ncbi:MAG: ABC transporter ATP-binding protein [Desulfovermiculus sp.]|nr:ABC transporter ATP-binding protein [Desulfovermiculus sp.]
MCDAATPLMRIEDLEVAFIIRKWGILPAGTIRAVDGVSFSLNRGEAVAIVGESGCGKSTLARTLLGLYAPSGGNIVFEGRNLKRFTSKERYWYRSRVGYVQQDPYGALPPFMNVKRILREPLIINKIRDRQRQEELIHKVLDEVRLTPVADFLPKFPHMLSGGQQQRLVIARSLILGPGLLIADEPVSMLDASVRVEILRLLRRIQDSHSLGLCYITHDLSTVRSFCSRILVMYGAKLIEEAQVVDLLQRPFHPYTQALLRAIPDPDPENAHTFRPVPISEPPSLMTPPPGCRFHPRCDQAISGLCDTDIPPHFQPEPEHRVACWLYKQA